MAELIFKSPGVSTREIDLSAPSQGVTSTGVPAGVIGTANEGPAFIPVTIPNFAQFQNIFGASDGEKFGPIAVSQWLKNAQACTYIRVLGVGDGKKRDNSTGVVNRSGFFVGDQTIQDDGNLGHNTYAFHPTGDAVLGRSYFLGCFMSESNGSTIFSDAGIQKATTSAGTKATAVDAIDTTGLNRTSSPSLIAFSIPSSLGGENDSQVTYILINNADDTGAGPAAGNTIGIGIDTGSVTEAQIAAAIIAAINGTAHARVTKADSGVGASTDGNVLGITAKQGTSDTQITLTADVGGIIGNISNGVVLSSGFDIVDVENFTGGIDGNHAVPILRGVLLAPSGVILHLSSSHGVSGLHGQPASNLGASADGIFGRKGSVTGSVNLNNQNFVMLLNGHKNTAQFPNVITASFNTTSKNYFPNKFNTDPLRIEKAGHLLYTDYGIHSNYASVTGSGVILTNFNDSTSTKTFEPIAFLLTSSRGRTETSPTSVIPLYEDFRDRYKTAVSPYVISQSPSQNLFRLHALSDGEVANGVFKISIENITRINSSKYPSFDLTVRKFDDTDEQKVVLESFRNINLDPDSDRYIARAIGDMHTFFEFDKDELSQKINVSGNHPSKSNYVRVEVATGVENKTVSKESMPFGFRGPLQVVTSGSSGVENLCKDTSSHFVESDILTRVIPPPIQYRQNIALGTGTAKRAANNLYWGPQFNTVSSLTEPNKQTLFDPTFNSLVKPFPTHRKDGRNVYEASDVIGRNIFNLEHIRVRTGSASEEGSDLAADVDNWVSASYVRSAAATSITPVDDDKTRAFRPADLETPGNRRYAKFTFFLQDGSDGTDIFNADKNKMTNNAIKREIQFESNLGGSKGPTASAYKKAIDIMSSKAEVDIKLLAIPGVRVPAVTNHAISAVENRFDALYLMDIEEYNNLNTIVTSSSDFSNVKFTVQAFKNRGLDSSFAAAYYPDVIMKDPTTGGAVSVPPSVAVLGAFSLNDAIAHPWFAPAGFSRGSLDSIESLGVRLSRRNLDDLYDADINPLTAFPGTGIVVFGQKTLLANASALDRVNVRRLLINVRRSIRNIANSLLFEPNRQETLDRFNSLVNPVMQRIQEQGGVDRYKVIIDTSTTTQADVENNTIRGKIFLQPTRAVEFIALDFVVTNAGAEL